MNQFENVKQYLLGGNSITPLEALNKFGSFRLSSIIFDLRKKGYNVKTELTSNGHGKRFAKYSIPTKVKNNGQISFNFKK